MYIEFMTSELSEVIETISFFVLTLNRKGLSAKQSGTPVAV
jgi:hypothetical protein